MNPTRRQIVVPAAVATGLIGLGFHGLIERGLQSKGLLWHRSLHPRRQAENAGWRKDPANPLIGGWNSTCFDVSVLREDNVYKMWLSWRKHLAIAYATSPDGRVWTQPEIVLPPLPASASERNVSRPTVLKKDGMYRMWYTGQTHNSDPRIFHAVSRDGVAWNRRAAPVLVPELAWEADSVMCPSVLWDESSRQFRMWYSAGAEETRGEPKFIGYAVSDDGLRWEKHSQPVFHPSGADAFDRERTAACSVVRFDGWHYMFYVGFYDTDTAAIGVARSRDGVTLWQRHRRNPILAADETYFAWDRDAVYKPSVWIDGNRWQLWYNGRKGRMERIGLAVHEGLDLAFES